ncbi:MAG: uridine kinase [Verrucomicrobiota bacterium]
MNPRNPPCLVAITGGSGSGKTWLADRLWRDFAPFAARLSMDDFYLDLSSLPPEVRERNNFDRPDALDCELFESVLRRAKSGEPVWLPCYDFATHTRTGRKRLWRPAPLVLVDGLWPLVHPHIRPLFNLGIFLECDESLRLERRLARDTAERGRTAESVHEQFRSCVAPMHGEHVAPQARWADLLLAGVPGEKDYAGVKQMIETRARLAFQSGTAGDGQRRGEEAGGRIAG